MGQIVKHDFNYHNTAIWNLYQLFLKRYPSDEEYRHYEKEREYDDIYDIVSSSLECQDLLRVALKTPVPTLDKIIPYTVIKINDRAAKTIENLDSLLFGKFTKITDIDFYDASTVDLQDFFKSRNLHVSWFGDLFGLGNKFVAGELGVLASNISILEYMVEHDIPELLVFEDDAILDVSFVELFSKCRKDLPPDFDFLSDTTLAPNYEEVATNTEPTLIDSIFINRAHLQNAPAVCMFYTLTGAKKILEEFKKSGIIAPWDTMIFYLNRKKVLNGYSTFYTNKLIKSTDYESTIGQR